MNKQEPYLYKDINEVPEGWRRLRGGTLNLDKINVIAQRAYELGHYVDENDMENSAFIPDYGMARQEFMESSELIDGQWATRTDN